MRAHGRGAAVLAWGVALAVGALLAAGCGERRAGAGGVSGVVEVDGSSTVYPITEAVVEEFTAATGGQVQVTVGVSGTGGGFKRFCAGEIDVANASRPIDDAERAACEANGIAFLEIPVASDGIAIVVHPDNTFVDCLTVEELERIWEPGSRVRLWSDVRPGWPAEPIRLYGPGTDSGTFDYFTEAIVGRAGASRPDYTASEDDNVLVQGVEGDPGALGYFGYAYYEANRDRLKLVGVDAGGGCVRPSPETIRTGRYRPLSRPLFLYVRRDALARPAVREFVRFYIDNEEQLTKRALFIDLTDAQQRKARQEVEKLAG